MSPPLYYIELYGLWRSMRPPVWRKYAGFMVAHLQDRVEAPLFEEYGKPVYGRPSRIKVGEGPGGKTVYWTEDKHLQIRTPEKWNLEDWKFELESSGKHCKAGTEPGGPDIFNLILKK